MMKLVLVRHGESEWNKLNAVNNTVKTIKKICFDMLFPFHLNAN